jgi:sec-independent protein translocase protein TatA
MFGIGTTELLVIGFVVLLLFGKNLPGVMRSLGQSVTEFKRGLSASDENGELTH